MSGDSENTESQYGFKTAEKAEQTIKLLGEHEKQYQTLTIRGLLERAKRVLKITKVEDKRHNIQAAIEVFTKWIEQNSNASTAKNAKSSSDEKVPTVAGLGFKDEAAATKTLEILEGRDPNYQKLAVRGLIGNSKRVLQATKNADKLKSIKAGVKILEDFLDEFDRDNRGQQNKSYLPIDIIEACKAADDKLAVEFVQVYADVATGRYEFLRTLYPKKDDSISWDIVRNTRIARIEKDIQANKAKLFNDDGTPTADHLKLIQWAYSPSADKLKAYVASRNGDGAASASKKRKSSDKTSDSGAPAAKKKSSK